MMAATVPSTASAGQGETVESMRHLLEELNAKLERIVDHLVTPLPQLVDGKSAYRWRHRSSGQGGRELSVIEHVGAIDLDDLYGIDRQKRAVVANIEQFMAGQPANHILLTGCRGSGKSSLARALLKRYRGDGLCLIEVDKTDLVDCREIAELVYGRPEKYLLFCDDLSFDQGEGAYKALKVVLEGSLAAMPSNLLIMATSNRRHLMPEVFADNRRAPLDDDDSEIHPGESSEEKISLSERFGLWLSFPPFSQEVYWSIVRHYLKKRGYTSRQIAAAKTDALRWALARGSRSGRVAEQFTRHWLSQRRPGSRAH